MTAFEFIGGLTLGLSVILITNKLVKTILDMEVCGCNKQTKVEEDWEDDETLDKWKDYPYDELDSRDE